MKTLSFLTAASLFLAADLGAQCVDLPNRCGPARVQCFGRPNIGCSNFGVQATNLDPRVFGTIALIADCAARPLPIPSPPACGMGSCLLYVDLPAIVLSVPPNPAGGAALRLPVPNDPGAIGVEICVQFAQFARDPAGGGCVSLSNGLAIQVGRGPCQ